jgi:hypothetical protein
MLAVPVSSGSTVVDTGRMRKAQTRRAGNPSTSTAPGFSFRANDESGLRISVTCATIANLTPLLSNLDRRILQTV